MKQKVILYKLWRTLLPFIFIFLFMHFLKDLTQDVLGLNTPLDVLGGIVEDISHFPSFMKSIYIWAMVNTYFGELFLLVSIPIILKKKNFSKLEIFSIIVFFYIILMFMIALLLDPRFSTRMFF